MGNILSHIFGNKSQEDYVETQTSETEDIKKSNKFKFSKLQKAILAGFAVVLANRYFEIDFGISPIFIFIGTTIGYYMLIKDSEESEDDDDNISFSKSRCDVDEDDEEDSYGENCD